MKRILLISIIALFIGTMANAQSPATVARQFLTALYSGDKATMGKLLEENEAKIQMKHTWRGDSQALDMLKKSESQTFDSDISSSIKVVRFYYPKRDTSKKNNGSFASVELVQQRGEWKVIKWGY